MGWSSKIRQFDRKVREIDGSHMCLQWFDSACKILKRKFANLQKLAWKNSWNNFGWTYFWWVFISWNHCGSVRRSERRSAFPCFSYFMIPKREWERIDYNDGHQATTIEQKKYGYLCMPHCRIADAAAAASRTIRGRYSGVPNRLLCTFIIFQDCFHPLLPTWNYCLVLKFPCIFGLFICFMLTA